MEARPRTLDNQQQTSLVNLAKLQSSVNNEGISDRAGRTIDKTNRQHITESEDSSDYQDSSSEDSSSSFRHIKKIVRLNIDGDTKRQPQQQEEQSSDWDGEDDGQEKKKDEWRIIEEMEEMKIQGNEVRQAWARGIESAIDRARKEDRRNTVITGEEEAQARKEAAQRA